MSRNWTLVTHFASAEKALSRFGALPQNLLDDDARAVLAEIATAPKLPASIGSALDMDSDSLRQRLSEMAGQRLVLSERGRYLSALPILDSQRAERIAWFAQDTVTQAATHLAPLIIDLAAQWEGTAGASRFPWKTVAHPIVGGYVLELLGLQFLRKVEKERERERKRERELERGSGRGSSLPVKRSKDQWLGTLHGYYTEVEEGGAFNLFPASSRLAVAFSEGGAYGHNKGIREVVSHRDVVYAISSLDPATGEVTALGEGQPLLNSIGALRKYSRGPVSHYQLRLPVLRWHELQALRDTAVAAAMAVTRTIAANLGAFVQPWQRLPQAKLGAGWGDYIEMVYHVVFNLIVTTLVESGLLPPVHRDSGPLATGGSGGGLTALPLQSCRGEPGQMFGNTASGSQDGTRD